MKNLLVSILVFGFLGFSSASAKAVQDFDDQTIMEVINAPTKNIIVEGEIGDVVIEYNWHKGNKFLEIKGYYASTRGVIVDKGIEKDSKGRDYNFVIAYFKNKNSKQGNFIKFTQYPWKKNSMFLISGESNVDLPVVHFIVTDRSWTNIYLYNEKGGYSHRDNFFNLL